MIIHENAGRKVGDVYVAAKTMCGRYIARKDGITAYGNSQTSAIAALAFWLAV
jgi:hypothetical protein